jgi:hypothetical protein
MTNRQLIDMDDTEAFVEAVKEGIADAGRLVPSSARCDLG